MTHPILYLFPLDSSLTSPWVYPFFSSVRSTLTKGGSFYQSLALSLCCLFIGINLIKIIIDLTSDDQGSGFADISLHTLIRPFIFVAVISSFGTLYPAFDSLVNSISISMTADIPHKSTVDYASVLNQIEETEANALKKILTDKEEEEYLIDGKRVKGKYLNADGTLTNDFLNTIANAGYKNEKQDSVIKANEQEIEKLAQKHGWNSNLWIDVHGYKVKYGAEQYMEDHRYDMDTAGTDNDFGKYLEMKAKIESAFNYRDRIKDNLKSMRKMGDKAKTDRDNGAVIACWLFDVLYFVMECFAEFYLVVLALMGPVIMSMSILGLWKDIWKSYISKYVEISLWKVVASIICYCVCNARHAAIKFNLDVAAVNLTGGEQMEDISVWIVRGIFSIAGIFALISIPSMTSTLLGIASGGTAGLTGGGSEMKSVVGGAAGGAVKTGKTAASTVSGHAGQVAQKALSSSVQNIEKAVGSMSGGGFAPKP